MSVRRAVVVGTGPAGLASAAALVQAGCQVALLQCDRGRDYADSATWDHDLGLWHPGLTALARIDEVATAKLVAAGSWVDRCGYTAHTSGRSRSVFAP